MPPKKTPRVYREPSDVERAFLRIVTRGHDSLERQIEHAQIAEYDVTGWCDVLVLAGPRAVRQMTDGPALHFDEDGLTTGVSWPDAPPTCFVILDGAPVEVAPPPPSGEPTVLRLETILWTGDDGMLSTVEVLSIGDGYVTDPYGLFVEADAADPKRVQYPDQKRSDGGGP